MARPRAAPEAKRRIVPARAGVRPFAVHPGASRLEVCRCPEEIVRWVQSRLNRVRGLRLRVDGIMDPATRSALRAFQQDNGLPGDGIAGPETQRALEQPRHGTSGPRDGQAPAEAAPVDDAPAAEPGELEELEEQFLSGLFDQLGSAAQQGMSYVKSQLWGAPAPPIAPGGAQGWQPLPPGPTPSRGPVHIDVPFRGFQSNDRAGCFRRSTEMAKAVGVTVGGPDVRIQVATREDSSGRVTIDPARAQEGLAYIDGQLDARRPVCVGVSYMDSDYNADAITDHFVLITTRGVDEQRRLYYAFHDPAASRESDGGDRNPANRFYLQATGGLSRPPSPSAPLGSHTYDVAMVRRNV